MTRIGVLLLVSAAVCSASAQSVQAPADVRQMILHGQLDEAERLARAGGDASLVTLGDIAALRGQRALADSLYHVAVARHLPAYRSAAAGLAELATLRGDRDDATRDAATAIAGYTATGASWPGDDQVAVGRAFAVLGRWDPQSFHDALRAFDRAVAADSGNLDAQLRGADLLLDKYNAPDARDGYRAVLRRSPTDAHALYGLARILAFDGSGDPTVLLSRALAANNTFVPALLLLAEQDLQAEAYDSATVVAQRALRVDSGAVAAWGILGAMAWMRGDSIGYEMDLAAAKRIQPHPADFLAEIAEAAGRQRRYADAVMMGVGAVAADSTSARAYGVLGENQLRTGDMIAGRANIERAFALDPYNLWHKNMLDLLDNLRGFRTVTTARFQLVAPADEADYLKLYVGPLLEAAYDTFATKYGYRPPTPIRVEYYGRHADFSVRTTGLTGLGALGVSFGTVLVLDSPRAEAVGELNYGSTSWHELGHTFTLGLSDHRVPRWISEGLSVLEERQAGRGWGFDVSPDFLAAYKGNALPPPSRLNDGLVRPQFPAEIGASYYEASLAMEMIEAEHGLAAVRGLLQAYGRGLDTPAAFEAVLQLTPEAFDAHFDRWMRARFAGPLAAIDSSDGQHPVTGTYIDLETRGAALVEAAQPDSARAVFRQAETLFPGDGTDGSPASHLAALAQSSGDLHGAAIELHKVTMHSETAFAADEAEALLLLQIGDSTGALAAWQREQWINPYQVSLHERLAALSEALHDYPMAVRERRAIVALAPSDPSEARYEVARVLVLAGDKVAARRELLALLEQVPSFERAQLLLLQLQNGPT